MPKRLYNYLITYQKENSVLQRKLREEENPQTIARAKAEGKKSLAEFF